MGPAHLLSIINQHYSFTNNGVTLVPNQPGLSVNNFHYRDRIFTDDHVHGSNNKTQSFALHHSFSFSIKLNIKKYLGIT